MRGLVLAMAWAGALLYPAGVSAGDILLLTDEASLQVEIDFVGYSGTPSLFQAAAAGMSWSGSAFNSTAIELAESVEDDFFSTAAGTAKAELGGSAGSISHTIWPQARTDHQDTFQIVTQPWARADVRLRFLVDSPSDIPLELAVIAPEGEGGVRLYNETTAWAQPRRRFTATSCPSLRWRPFC